MDYRKVNRSLVVIGLSFGNHNKLMTFNIQFYIGNLEQNFNITGKLPNS